MSNTYVDIIKEIETRLRNAQTQDRALWYVKNIYIGERERVVGLVDTPSITLSIDSISSNFDVVRYGQISDQLVLTIRLDYGIDEDNTNKDNILFDYDHMQGVVFFIEDIMDTLFEDTDGNIDGVLNNTLSNTMTYEIRDMEKTVDNMWHAIIELTMISKHYTINERSA